MQRLLALIGPLPFIGLAIVAAGLSLAVAVWLFDTLSLGLPAAGDSVWRYALTGLLLAILQMVLVILLRAHWTLDVLGGLFAALLAGVVFWPT